MSSPVTPADHAQRPVILTVDDDDAVGRAIARDLRRRYGRSHRIVRAQSPIEALDALREMVLRGDQVAVLLADYRMPELNGIEFLERAMDLVPRARRALLTAYADTDAAIAAINVVDVDHYLVKPWQPPEEKLYPVIDALLAVFDASKPVDRRQLKLIGHRWSRPSFEIRDFLARNGVPYHWMAADEEKAGRLLAAADAGPADVPVLVTTDGTVLRRPTTAQVAAAVGLATTPAAEFYDLVIVGAGPAGLGAAVYAASEGLRTIVIEQLSAGGQAGQSSRIENYLGFPDGISGAQLTDRARRQAERFGAELLTARTAVDLTTRGPARVVTLDDGAEIAAHAVVLATGVAYRELAAEGAGNLVGRGVFYGSTMIAAKDCADQQVIIVGGANSAGQAAVFFSRFAAGVTLAVRGPDLHRTMSSYLIEQIEALPTIEVRTCTEVTSVAGQDHLEAVTLTDTSTGAEETITCGQLFIFIGAAPRTDWLPPELLRDDRGFLLTGPTLEAAGPLPAGWDAGRQPLFLESSVPGVFVAGDVRDQSVKRVASAVGEGALAVTLVHQYLEGH